MPDNQIDQVSSPINDPTGYTEPLESGFTDLSHQEGAQTQVQTIEETAIRKDASRMKKQQQIAAENDPTGYTEPLESGFTDLSHQEGAQTQVQTIEETAIRKDASRMKKQQQIAAERNSSVSHNQPSSELGSSKHTLDITLMRNSMCAMLQLLNEIKDELKNLNNYQKGEIKSEKKDWQKSFTEKAQAYESARQELEKIAARQMQWALGGLATKLGDSFGDRTFGALKMSSSAIPDGERGTFNQLILALPALLDSTRISTPLSMLGQASTAFATKIDKDAQLNSYTTEASTIMADGKKEAHRMSYDAMKEFDGQVSGAIEQLNQTISELLRLEARAYEARS